MKMLNLIKTTWIVTLLFWGCSGKYAHLKQEWKFTQYIKYKDSARQRSTGFLSYRNRLLPEKLSAIVCPAGSFFRQKNSRYSSADDGWIPEKGSIVSFFVPETPQLFTKSDLRRGYYAAGLMQKKKGTPTFWIWVSFKGQGYWMLPAGVFYYITIIK